MVESFLTRREYLIWMIRVHSFDRHAGVRPSTDGTGWDGIVRISVSLVFHGKLAR